MSCSPRCDRVMGSLVLIGVAAALRCGDAGPAMSGSDGSDTGPVTTGDPGATGGPTPTTGGPSVTTITGDPTGPGDTGVTDPGLTDPGVTDTGRGDTGESTDTGEPPTPLFLDGMFPIGVFSQPIKLMDTWKQRGINTMVQHEPEGGAVSIDAWSSEASARGLYMIRKPREDPAADVDEPLLLAWAHVDEPDRQLASYPASDLQGIYAGLKATAPDIPVWINFSGFTVMSPNPNADNSRCNGPGDGSFEECYPDYIAAADWLCNDNYPVAGYNSDDLSLVGRTLDRLGEWGEGRPQFVFIETSDQDAPWIGPDSRGVTPDEFRAEVWDGVIHGARGVFYFPDRPFGNFAWDATPPDVVAEMIVQNQLLTELAPVLQSAIDPPSHGLVAEAPLEGAWRSTAAGAHFFVLNLSKDPRPGASVTLEGVDGATSATVYGEGREVALVDGVLTDDFAGHGVHIYVVP